MTPGQRVVLNTLATYTRTVFSIALGLFSGRWILEALGNIDYGLMGVVGSLIGFVSVLNSIVSGTCARFFALSIGKGNVKETKKWFNTALAIHTILPAILVIIGWPTGEWFITHYCNIPPDRLSTAQWVFSFSMLSTFVTMMSAPYMGMLMAKQRIAEVSAWQILSTLCSFCFCYWLLSYKGDKWFVYGFGSVAISMVFTIIQSWRSRHLYEECSFCAVYCKEKHRYKQIFSFASWQLFGGLTGIFRGNLIAILINKNFPPLLYPSANSSMQIGQTLSAHSESLSNALRGAITPELTSTEGSGNRSRMLNLALQTSKFSCLLILFIAVPLCIEIKEVLGLWLVNPPEYAWYFAVFFILAMFVDNMTSGYIIAINAVGKIKWYQLTVGGILLAAYPLACLLILVFKLDFYTISWALFFTTFLASMTRVIWAKKLVGAPIRKWLSDVFIPLLLVALISTAIGATIKQILTTSDFVSILIVSAITLITTAFSSYLILLRQCDKEFLHRIGTTLRTKFCRKK